MKKVVILLIALFLTTGCISINLGNDGNKEEENAEKAEDKKDQEETKDKEVDESEVKEESVEDQIRLLIAEKNELVMKKKELARPLVGKEKGEKMREINLEISKLSEKINKLKADSH